MSVITYLLNASVQESNILTSARVALGLEIDALELQVLQVLLQSSLLLVQLNTLLALSCNILLHFLCQSLRAAHLANRGRSHVFLVCKLRLEVEDFAV